MGELDKGRDILAAIRTLKTIEAEGRQATQAERMMLAGFGGFGALALKIFPNPVTGEYPSHAWATVGRELRFLLSDEEYASAKRTVFNAFYTAPVVMRAMFRALNHLGVPADGTVLEPGSGIGNFLDLAPSTMHFIGVELDSLSGRIARARFPQHDIRIEDFRETRLKDNSVDAVIGNPPFADVTCRYRGDSLSLHDYFLVRSLDALKPEGVLALVTSHFTMDRTGGLTRRLAAERADFLAGIRLPSDAFKDQGTSVVADILFFRKRRSGQEPSHNSPHWLEIGTIDLDGSAVSVNRYFLEHPRNVLGTWSRQDTLYGANGYSIRGEGPKALAERLEILSPARWAYPGTEDQPPSGVESVSRPAPGPLRADEGHFEVDASGTILQVSDGRLVPVVYGGTALRSDGTMSGRRLAALIGLRDAARGVLRSQNEGQLEAAREAARVLLNDRYEAFVGRYGPVNKTSIGETKDGATVRRMPNLAKFREDPDAMLVMALEHYDEDSGLATKSAILLRDVVGPRPEPGHVDSAEAGLLVSLDRRGRIDLPFLSSLYGRPVDVVVEELGDLIYRDPESGSWETADAYLSGNVRARLAAAEAAGPDFARNAEALRAVQPEDILPGDIDANLGAPWVPVADIRAFAAQLFDLPEREFSVAHLKKDAVWSFEAGYRAHSSVAVTAEYGTKRIDGIELFRMALNQKHPAIYDTEIGPDRREHRIFNPEETLAAREKYRRIRDAFKAWAFAESARADRLVRLYNDAYNNLRPRLFDGSHLDFPGMSQAITLHPHQRAGAWRIMAGGNTLLAHVVGSGKTYTMVAAAMKMRQAGLIRKPVFAVPNAILEQFAREFLHLYPEARILVANAEDMGREKRKVLTAKIASGDWDGILTTHSGFERIAMSAAYQARFVRDQLAEYEALLVEARRSGSESGGRNIIKTIEKQKERYAQRLKDLLAREKKDDGLVFDELGIDHIFIDESHYFKNLDTPTKMERVAGIQTSGSERAFDLYMKCRYLHGQNPGRGITFASGTPISNTMVEMYTAQRFLDPSGLESRHIDHFDAWAATFGEVVESMEISPDGATLRPRCRFARFVNLPELVQLFRSFADVQTADMLDLPRPEIDGGKPAVVSRPMSPGQRESQNRLVERYERIRSTRVDPKEDNALSITTDGRKLALDGRLLDVPGDVPDSKLNALVANVVRTWQSSLPFRGTQLVFCDLGVHPRPFSVYDDVIAKLVEAGIPAAQVAVIGDADTDAKKRVLFDKVNRGAVRILIGSTARLGTGTNVQKRLVALHHLDAPWKPAEVEQREGRILRQGNQNASVGIYRYVTEGSFDAFMWQALETKARFIGQVMSGQASVRKADDIAGQELSYAEVKAIASGNPAVMTLARSDAELQRLAILRRNHADEQFVARRQLAELPGRLERLDTRIAGMIADRDLAASWEGEPLQVAGHPHNPERPLSTLGDWMEGLPVKVSQTTRFPIGTYRGIGVGMVLYAFSSTDVYLEGRSVRRTTMARDNPGPRAVLNAIERLARDCDLDIEFAQRERAIAADQLAGYRERAGHSFAHQDYADELGRLRDTIQAGLAGDTSLDLVAIAAQAEGLMGTHQGEVAARTVVVRSLAAEEPVTARILRRLADPVEVPEPAASGSIPQDADRKRSDRAARRHQRWHAAPTIPGLDEPFRLRA